MEKTFSAGLRATASTDDVVQVRKNYPVFRILVHIYSDIPDKNMLIKNYYVWATEDFVSDSLHLRKAPGDNDYALAALQELSGRVLADPEGEIPSENGLDCSNEHGVVTVNDAENYVHPVEREA
jgi:hypothetical protein